MISDIAFIIPARIGSTRLPEKSLKKIGDKTMIEHVYTRVSELGTENLYVATDSQEISDVIKSLGGKSIMTKSDCPSGTDRVFEAMHSIKNIDQIKYVVNIQGDLPFIHPQIIEDLITKLKNTNADISTPVVKVRKEYADTPNNVKVVVDKNDFALYFSRSPIPHNTEEYLYHLGIYAFKKDSLKKFVLLGQSMLEKLESLEQLRALENGMKIVVSYADAIPLSVDTASDLEEARKLYASGKLL